MSIATMISFFMTRPPFRNSQARPTPTCIYMGGSPQLSSQSPQGCSARGPAGQATPEVRVGGEPQDCEVSRPRHPAVGPGGGGFAAAHVGGFGGFRGGVTPGPAFVGRSAFVGRPAFVGRSAFVNRRVFAKRAFFPRRRFVGPFFGCRRLLVLALGADVLRRAARMGVQFPL